MPGQAWAVGRVQGGPKRETNHTQLIWHTIKPLGSSPRVTITEARCCGAACFENEMSFSTPQLQSGQKKKKNPDYILNVCVVSFVLCPLRNIMQIRQTDRQTEGCSGSLTDLALKPSTVCLVQQLRERQKCRVKKHRFGDGQG